MSKSEKKPKQLLADFAENYITIKEICTKLSTDQRKFNHQAIRHLINTNQVTSTKIGGVIYVELESLNNYIIGKTKEAKIPVKPNYAAALQGY